MRVFFALLFFCLTTNSVFSQYDWFYLNNELQEIDAIEKANYKVKFLHDSLDYKIYSIIDINNNCNRQDYFGYLRTKDINTKSFRMILYYDSTQVRSINSYSNGLEDGDCIEYYKNNRVDAKGQYVNGEKNGVWLWHFENGQVSSKETYEMGVRKSVEMWDSLGTPIKNPEKVDGLPKLKKNDKDMNAFRQHIVKNLRYPDKAAESGITGTVMVQFCVDKEGNLIDAKVIKRANPFLDEEALRLVKMCKKWLPAIQHNRPVDVSFVFPVIFRLQ